MHKKKLSQIQMNVKKKKKNFQFYLSLRTNFKSEFIMTKLYHYVIEQILSHFPWFHYLKKKKLICGEMKAHF
jgi:hypothetical protein